MDVVLGLLAKGATYEAVLQIHPTLEEADILAYALYLVAGKNCPSGLLQEVTAS